MANLNFSPGGTFWSRYFQDPYMVPANMSIATNQPIQKIGMSTITASPTSATPRKSALSLSTGRVNRRASSSNLATKRM